MKGTSLLLGLIAVAAILAVLYSPPSARRTEPAASKSLATELSATTMATSAIAPRDSTPAGTLAPTSPQSGAGRAGSPLAAELNAPGFDAHHDVATLHAILRQYLRLLHGRQGLPIGNDSDLSRVLTGRNPMKLVLLPPTHPAITADGRLRDRWGTPYFIHARGNLAFEIRSAGSDRKLFTTDDIVENPGDALSPDLPSIVENAAP